MGAEQTILEIINHALNRHPELSSSIKKMLSSRAQAHHPREHLWNQATLTRMKRIRKSMDCSYYSQSGEDGLLEYFLGLLPQRDNWCVEFGAWDGIHLSNTHYFLSEKGYTGVLIEGDTERYRGLVANMQKFRAHCLNAIVGLEKENGLDRLLARTGIPHDFDFLSIDIDGNDYWVWAALENYRPKMIIIELNIPDKPGTTRVNVPGSPLILGISGTSISSMTELAEKKGYALIGQVGCNAVYIRNDLYGHVFSQKIYPEDVFGYSGNDPIQLTMEEKQAFTFWNGQT